MEINLGGEGEVPGVLNQQGPWVILDHRWLSSRGGRPFRDLVADGLDFLICPNTDLPLDSDSIERVYTVGVPVDWVSTYGPGVQSSEIRRILKSGGTWIHDDGANVWTWTKP